MSAAVTEAFYDDKMFSRLVHANPFNVGGERQWRVVRKPV